MDLSGDGVVDAALVTATASVFVLTGAEGHERRVVAFREADVTSRTLTPDTGMVGSLWPKPALLAHFAGLLGQPGLHRSGS